MKKLLRKLLRKAAAPQPSAAYKLAVIHRDQHVAANDPLVALFQVYLAKLAGIGAVPELKAADICVHTHSALKGHHPPLSLLQVARDLCDAVPECGLGGASLEELSGAYVYICGRGGQA